MVLHRDVCDTLDPIEVKNSENSKVIKNGFQPSKASTAEVAGPTYGPFCQSGSQISTKFCIANVSQSIPELLKKK